MPVKGPRLLVTCTRGCQLHPEKVGPAVTAVLVAMRENGAGAHVMSKRATELLGRDKPFPTTSMERHLGHFREVEGIVRQQEMPATKLGDLEILDLVIQRGAANSVNWKPTIKDTIEAMKLKIQMTGNSAFDDLISLFDGEEADEFLPEAQEAVLAPEERPDDEDEPLGEVLIDS